jgi:hypothetical protein
MLTHWKNCCEVIIVNVLVAGYRFIEDNLESFAVIQIIGQLYIIVYFVVDVLDIPNP